MKKAFSLVELMIVVAVLGILAAAVLPSLSAHVTKAKETAAKDNLRILREAVLRYAAQHKDVAPGYYNGDTSGTPDIGAFVQQLLRVTNEDGQVGSASTAEYSYGPYLLEIPENPLASRSLYPVWMISNSQSLPSEATGDTAWIYKASTKTVKLNWPGTDSQGVAYYDY